MVTRRLRSNKEGRTLQQFAEERPAAFLGVVIEYPESIPEIYPGYRERYQNVAGRLFVPKHTVTKDRSDRSEVRATTPRQHQHSQSIGIIAASGASTIKLDAWMVAPTELQRVSQEAFIRAHGSMAYGGNQVRQEMTSGLRDA